MGLEITGLYAGLFAILLVALSYRVSLGRRATGIGIGTGDDAGLERTVRAQGNFIEYVPIGLILLAILEFDGSASWVLHFFGAGLLLGRLLHAVGLSRSAGVSLPRFWGTMVTWTILLGLGVGNLYRAFT